MGKKKNKSRKKAAPALDENRDRAREKSLATLVESIISPMGLELVQLKFQSEFGGRVLRIFLDRPEGISIDDCAKASRHISDAIDLVLTDDISFRLEVSSPGADRPLTKEEHFKRFIGKYADIRLFSPVNGRAGFTGRITGAENGIIELLCEGNLFEFNFSDIKSAKLNIKNR